MTNDFETKLAMAGATLEKLASERGLDLTDFTEQETVDLLSTIMGDSGGEESKTASVPAAYVAAPAKVAAEGPQLTYGQVMAEVVKVASANGYDITKASPAELDDAVQKMAAMLSDPGFMMKQAALQEKVAEADAMGRVMAHAYVDELGKIAKEHGDESEKHERSESKDEEEKEEAKEEKKAALLRSLRGKTASATPPSDDAFAKAAGARASEMLISSGINPATGAKFASEQEAVDAGATLLLQQKGYL